MSYIDGAIKFGTRQSSRQLLIGFHQLQSPLLKIASKVKKKSFFASCGFATEIFHAVKKSFEREKFNFNN